MHCHELLTPLSGAPGFTNVCHLDKICNLTFRHKDATWPLDIKMHKYKYTNTNTNEHIQYKCANFAEWLHLFKLDRWSEKYTNIRSPWCSIHNAGFDDACIHDSTNYAYIIDAYIYDEGGRGILSVTEEMEKRDCYRGILGIWCMYLRIAWMHAWCTYLLKLQSKMRVSKFNTKKQDRVFD